MVGKYGGEAWRGSMVAKSCVKYGCNYLTRKLLEMLLSAYIERVSVSCMGDFYYKLPRQKLTFMRKEVIR